MLELKDKYTNLELQPSQNQGLRPNNLPSNVNIYLYIHGNSRNESKQQKTCYWRINWGTTYLSKGTNQIYARYY